MSKVDHQLMHEYIDAAESLYSSLGIAVHSEGGEVVAFTTTKTVEALQRFHLANNALARAVGAVEPKGKE